MGIRTILFYFLFCILLGGTAQVNDDFSDGDFVHDPVWSGDDLLWVVDGQQLRSNNMGANTYYLSTPSTVAEMASWEFFIDLKFATSGVNYADVFLMADEADLTTVQNGYFVRIGDTQDEIVLYKLSAGTAISLIDEANGVVNSSSSNPFKIRVTRSGAGLWALDYDDGITGLFTHAGTATDDELITSSFFGIRIVQSSAASPVNSHFFDDFLTTLLKVDSIAVTSEVSLEVFFNFSLDDEEAGNIGNYSIDGINIQQALLDQVDPSKITITLDELTPLTTQDFILEIGSGLTKNEPIDFHFSYKELVLESVVTLSANLIQLNFNDLLDEESATNINNFVVNQGVGMPVSTVLESEDHTKLLMTLGSSLSEGIDYLLSVAGLKNEKLNSTFDGLSEFDFVVPLLIENAIAMTSGSVLVSFSKPLDPSLAENTDNYLLDHGVGIPLDAGLQPDGKSVLLNFDHTFLEANYALAVNHLQDTQGHEIGLNSVAYFSYNPIRILSLMQQGDATLNIHFNQPVDEGSATNTDHFHLSGIGSPSSAQISEGNDSVVLIIYPQLFNSNYTLVIDKILNAEGNAELERDSIDFKFYTSTAFRAVTINEVMADFNPSAGLPDAEYIELYNPGPAAIRIEQFLLNGEWLPDYLLNAEEYVLIVDDDDAGLFASTPKLISIPSFDALTNSGDTVILRDQYGNLVDSIFYQLSWYRDTKKDDGGFSLEQINPLDPCSDETNWTASENAIGGTPGYENSVMDEAPDSQPPVIQSLNVFEGNKVRVTFNEPIDENSVDLSGFGLKEYEVLEFLSTSYREVVLTLNDDLVSEQHYTLNISNIVDCWGNLNAEDSITFFYDITPPEGKEIIVLSQHEVAVVFHEPISPSSATNKNNFIMDHHFGHPAKAALQDSAMQRVHLTFDSVFQVTESYTISVNGIADTSGNTGGSQLMPFLFDDHIDSVVVIAANLLGVQFKLAPQTPLFPSSFLVNGNVGQPVSVLIDEDDSTLVRLAFEKNFDTNKYLLLFMEGLKSVETHEKLITPANGFIYDTRPPRVEEIQVLNDSQLIVRFDEAIDFQTAFSVSQYELGPLGYPADLTVTAPDQIRLTFEGVFQMETTLTLKITEISDVYGNAFGTRNIQFVYDPLPPSVLGIRSLSETELEIIFSEKLDTSTVYNQDFYQLESTTPEQVSVSGPDSVRVRLTLMEIPESPELSLLLFGLRDQLGNVMDTTWIPFNSRNPAIAHVDALTDSTLLTTFSKNMSPAVLDPESYDIPGYVLNGVEEVAPRVYLLKIDGHFQHGDSIQIRFNELTDTGGNPLLHDTFSLVVNTCFVSWEYLDIKGLGLLFDTEFQEFDPFSLRVDGQYPEVALSDGTNKGLIRLVLKDSLRLDVPFKISWTALTDRFGRRWPDQELEITIDRTPPKMTAVVNDYLNRIQVVFSEPLRTTSFSKNHYIISGLGTPITTEKLSDRSLALVYSGLINGESYQLITSGIADLTGNVMDADTLLFNYLIPKMPGYGEILINEIMADPTPSVGLPEAEYVELFNASQDTIHLRAVYFSDNSKTLPLPDVDLYPGDFIVLSGALPEVGNAFRMAGFPALGNGGDSLTLTNLNGEIIDQVSYSADWYGDPEKDDGGYSLELINPFSDCPGKVNWMASQDPSGGTPGTINSVFSLEPDQESPIIQAYEVLEEGISLLFSEPMDSLSVVGGTYLLDHLAIQGISVTGPFFDEAIIHFDSKPVAGVVYHMEIGGPRDCSGNEMKSTVISFGDGRAPDFNEVLITEIMADPEPPLGLPNSEYFELYNRSDHLISLAGITLKDATGQTALPAITIPSGEYLILCPVSSVVAFQSHGQVIGVSGWLSLNNGGEPLSLFNDEKLVFTIEYSDDWYDEPVDGGIALEMKDINNPCGGKANWGSSVHLSGGTPGGLNSIQEDIPDHFGPDLTGVEVLGDSLLRLQFSELLMDDRVQGIKISISPGEWGVSAIGYDPLQRDYLYVTLNKMLIPKTDFVVTIEGVVDCNGNPIGLNQAGFVLPEPADSLDVLISEVLFNPKAGGVDFVELYNASDKNINLMDWGIGRNNEGVLTSYAINQAYILLPGAYLALVPDKAQLALDYPKGKSEYFLEMERFPAYPNVSATVVLTDASARVMDEFTYHEDMHFSLLNDVKGVSLERISFDTPAADDNNWQSASSTVGFATPGYINSQRFEKGVHSGVLSIQPKVFVPANHGSTIAQDFTTINYRFGQGGKLANVNIYNRDGKEVRSLAIGISLDTNGFFRWDGTTNRGDAASTGIYLIVFEVFDNTGQKEVIKETVVVGR